MAIKKGAFELYTQERQLPEKKQISKIKTSHFFDDIDKSDIGSQSVHNRFTSVVDKFDGAAKNITDDKLTTASVVDFNSKEPKVECAATLMGADASENNCLIKGSQTVHNALEGKDSSLTITVETESNLSKESSISFSRLVGNQRKIIIALYKNMRLNKSDTTEELTLESIANLTGINPKSLKNTLFRLSSTGIISRADQKIGRGGWVKYRLNNQLVNEIQEKEVYIFLKK